MMHTIDLSVTMPNPMDEVVQWCRSTEARQCFPGARNVRGDGTGLFFDVGIKAPGAAPATVNVSEYLKDHGRSSRGFWFETSQVWMWPSRECATSWHLYRCTQRPGKTTLDFRWRYILPGLAGAQVLSAARFSRSIERAAEIYIDKLARRLADRVLVAS